MMFKDKVVIVTGAAMGIGKAIAAAFAREGAALVLGDIVADKLSATVEELKQGEPGWLGWQVISPGLRMPMRWWIWQRIPTTVWMCSSIMRGSWTAFLPIGEITDEVWNKVLA